MFEIIGFTGLAISGAAYVPQVVHLGKEHCSAGISSRSWVMWLTASVLVGTLAVHRHDVVFILLQASAATFAIAILVLAHRYRGMVCGRHKREAAGARSA